MSSSSTEWEDIQKQIEACMIVEKFFKKSLKPNDNNINDNNQQQKLLQQQQHQQQQPQQDGEERCGDGANSR